MVMTDGCGQSEANVINVYNLSGSILSLLPLGVVKKGLPIIRKLLRALSALSPLIRPIPITSRMLYSIMRMVLPLLRSGMKIVTEEERKLVKGGVGQPILDEDVKLIDPETGKEVPAGEPGEMYYKGPNLMLGYWPTPGKGIDEDGYLGSGDVYVMDEDGSFTVVDRTKDMVNVSGFKVYTEELDNFIAEHEAVFNAATIGLPDPDRPGSEKVKTFVQLREGYEPSKKLEEELTDLVAKNFPPYYKPKMYEFMELPLSSVDKIDKLALRKREEERRKRAT
jgi:acyl-coenzyme A synthetase/AMP-(fatty) acid ligase